MSGDVCKSLWLRVEIQDNGIIRDDRGLIIGRADDGWMRYRWQLINTGVCPCCGAKVVDA